MEACTSEARGESKSTDAGATGCTGAGVTVNSGVAETGATSTAGTTDSRGAVERRLSGASGSKDLDNVEDSRGTGATGFCTRGSSTFGAGGITGFAWASFGSAFFKTEAGIAGFAVTTPGAAFATGASTLGATGRGIAGEPLADDEVTASGAGAPCCGTEPMRSPGKRMPQKPTTGSVNSSSTYPLTFR